MKKILPTLLVFLFAVANAVGQQFSQTEKTDILVQFAEGTDAKRRVYELEKQLQAGLAIKKPLAPRFGFYLLSADANVPLDGILAKLNNQPDVLSAGPDREVSFRNGVPSDTLWQRQWNHQKLNLPEVWEVGTGGTMVSGSGQHEIVVAVLDSGFDLSHEDLQGNIWVNAAEANGQDFEDDGDPATYIDDLHGWNFVNNSPIFTELPHGLSVAGIIGAKGDNVTGVSGVNWDVKLMFLIVKNASQIVEAFNYVLEMRERFNQTGGQEGAFVVVTNGSFGIDKVDCGTFPGWAAMYDILGGAGVLSVAATVNANLDIDVVGDMPTSCTSDYLITVTNSNMDDEKVEGAGYGVKSIDLAAPGLNIPTLDAQDTYTFNFGGTSSACPQVSGAIALLYSMPCPDFADLALADPPRAALLMRRAILERAFRTFGLVDQTVTGGRLDVYESMQFIHGFCIAREEEREAGNFDEAYVLGHTLVRAFPNPVRDILRVNFGSPEFGEVSFRVFNSLGQEMDVQAPAKVVPFEVQSFTMDVGDWSSGVYFINVSGIEKKVTLRFVKI